MTMKKYIPLMVLALFLSHAPLANAIEIMAGTGKFIPLSKPAKAVFVANSEIADVSAEFANMLYVYGLKQGSTTLHVLDAEGKIAYTETITVSMNTAVVMDAIKQVLPNANIKAEFVGGRLVLKGMVKNASDAEVAMRIAQGFAGTESGGSSGSDSGIINMMTSAAENQVMLRVRIAEVNRNITQAFGVQWNLYGNDGNTFRTGLFSPRGAITTPDQETNLFDPGRSSYKVGGLTPNPYQTFLSYFGENLGVDVLLEALEDENMATVLAEPNLTALSGESASFLAGGEFPVVTSVNDGEINTEYKQFGVQLNFTPVVLSENRIRLNVKPEVSNLSDNGAVIIEGITIPAIESRKVETTVELGDGQGFLLGGLFQNNLKEGLEAVPGLGDLPILGPLFRSENFERKKSELMIIVTPSIVTPVSNPEVAFKSPQSDLRVPTFAQRAFGGQRLSDTLRPSRISGSETRKAGPSVPMGGAVME
ncbi:MAG: type II and III secretion system protein family protein [bacterium]